MVCRKSQMIPYVAGALVVALLAWATAISAGDQAAANGSAVNGQSRYKPVQGIHRDFGMKSMTGYFVRRDGQCQVLLMVIEKSDTAAASQQSATRIRLALAPGETASLDSGEGRSVNVTCGKRAASLIIDSAGRPQLAILGGTVIPAAVAARETPQQ